jgi:RHS repeat-associated protein
LRRTGRGVPLAIQLTGANRNDSQQALALVDAIPSLQGERGRPRHRITQNTNDTVTSDKYYFWCGSTLCLETDATNNNAITKRYFAEGVQISGQSLYYTQDRLGSVGELVDQSGVLQASYEYDPYGVRTQLSGAMNSDLGFASLFHESQSGFDLAKYRAYDSTLGRWLNRDPISEKGGVNLYDYVTNDPINLKDTTGFDLVIVPAPAPIYPIFQQGRDNTYLLPPGAEGSFINWPDYGTTTFSIPPDQIVSLPKGTIIYLGTCVCTLQHPAEFTTRGLSSNLDVALPETGYPQFRTFPDTLGYVPTLWDVLTERH